MPVLNNKAVLPILTRRPRRRVNFLFLSPSPLPGLANSYFPHPTLRIKLRTQSNPILFLPSRLYSLAPPSTSTTLTQITWTHVRSKIATPFFSPTSSSTPLFRIRSMRACAGVCVGVRAFGHICVLICMYICVTRVRICCGGNSSLFPGFMEDLWKICLGFAGRLVTL